MRYTFDDGARPQPAHHPVLRDPGQPGDLPRRLGRLPASTAGSPGSAARPCRSARSGDVGAVPHHRRLQPGAWTSPPSTPTRLRELQALFDGRRGVRRLPAERPDHAAGPAAQPAEPPRGTHALHAVPRQRAHAGAGRGQRQEHLLRPRRAPRGAGRWGRRRDHLPGRTDGGLVAVRRCDGRPTYLYNLFGRELTTVIAATTACPGEAWSRSRSTTTAAGLGNGRDRHRPVDGVEVAAGASSRPSRSSSR